MARKLQIKRGQKKNMPVLAEGELGFALDEKTVYVGTGAENVQVGAKATYAKMTMLASGWSNGSYSFEGTYPAAQYDLEIGPSDTATAEQMQAYGAALIPISTDSNIAIAKGEVPTIDIPLAIKVVKK